MIDSCKLMELRIPAFWAVTYNRFYDVEPIKGEQCLENWDYFTQDLLQISKLAIKDGSHYIPESYLLIDLGWHPDGDNEGEYGMVLVYNTDWIPLKSFNSPDRYEIKAVMEEWMENEFLNPMKDERILDVNNRLNQPADRIRVLLTDHGISQELFEATKELQNPQLEICFVNHPEITKEHLKYFAKHGHNVTIQKTAQVKLLHTSLIENGPSSELFEQIREIKDSNLEITFIEHSDITREYLDHYAKHGSVKKIRNIAKTKLNSKKFRLK